MNPEQFVEAVQSAFSFLVSEFGFSVSSTSLAAPECAVILENQTTRVEISYEIGARPWIALARASTNREEKSSGSRHSLEEVLAIRCPNALSSVAPGGDDTRAVTLLLYRQAKALRNHAGDILRGDFRSLDG